MRAAAQNRPPTLKGNTKTRFNEFARLARGTVNVAIGIAAMPLHDTPASERTIEKLNDLAPAVVATNGSITVGINSNGVIVVSSHADDWRAATAPHVRFRAVAYGRGTFVAVGYAGAVATSQNGFEWTSACSPTVWSLYSIAFGNNRFVAVGNEGAILRSIDGVRWKRVEVTDARLRSIVYGDGTFVAVGHDGTIISSREGSYWTFHDTRATDRLESVVFGNDRFVAVGWKGTIVCGHNDKWTVTVIPGKPRLERATFEAKTFQTALEPGLWISSVDGINWETAQSNSHELARLK
jgi:hypothetical protein